MAEAHLDHPGDVSWFKGYGPRTVIGPCPHDCDHAGEATIAWGPDYAHYELVECTEACARTCRAWTGSWPYGEGPKWKRTTEWVQVAALVTS